MDCAIAAKFHFSDFGNLEKQRRKKIPPSMPYQYLLYTIRVAPSWIQAIIPIKEFHFVMKRLHFIVDGDLDFNTLLSRNCRDGYGDMAHGF